MKFEKEEYIGQLKGVFSSKHPDLSYTETDYFFTEERKSLELTLEGITGERHYGFSFESDARMKNLYERGTKVRFSRQWLAISEYELEEVTNSLESDHKITAEHIGANLLLDNIERLSKLPMMSHLIISRNKTLVYKDPTNVVLVSYAEVKPCTIAAKAISEEIQNESISKNFVKCSNDFRGLSGWIEKGGTVKSGDYVFLLKPKGF